MATEGDPPHRTAVLAARAQAGDRGACDRLFALAAERALLFVRLRLDEALRAKVEPADVLHEADSQERLARAMEALDGKDRRGRVARFREHEDRSGSGETRRSSAGPTRGGPPARERTPPVRSRPAHGPGRAGRGGCSSRR